MAGQWMSMAFANLVMSLRHCHTMKKQTMTTIYTRCHRLCTKKSVSPTGSPE